MASVLEQPSRSAADGRRIAPQRKLPADTETSPADDASGRQDGRARQIREWLLLLLRFGITRDPVDEAAVFVVANDIDSLGLQQGQSAPSFFRRTSGDVCKAITTLDDPKRALILKRHLARIDEPRLRQAFRAAIDLEETPPKNKPRNVWAGPPRE